MNLAPNKPGDQNAESSDKNDSHAELKGMANRGAKPLVNSDLWLFLAGNTKGGRKTTTDSEGRFSFGEIPLGQYQLFFFEKKQPERMDIVSYQMSKRFIAVDHRAVEEQTFLFPEPRIRLRGQLSESRPKASIIFQKFSNQWTPLSSFNRETQSKTQFEVKVKKGIYQITLEDRARYALHLLVEFIEVSGERDPLDLGVLSLEPTNGFELGLDGLPTDYAINNLSLMVYRQETGLPRGRKLIFSPFLGIKDGGIVTGLPKGTYLLQIDDRHSRGIFKPSWQKKTITVGDGELGEVRLGITITRGCLVEVLDPNLTLDTITFLDPQTQTQVHVSTYDHFTFSNRVRHADVKPGTWTMQANTKEGKTFKRLVKIPTKGGIKIKLAPE